MNEPKDLLVPTDLINRIMQYLAQKPWVEANPLIKELTNCRPPRMEVPKGDDGSSKIKN